MGSKSDCVICKIAKTTISQIAKVAKIATNLTNFSKKKTFANATFLKIKLCCVAIATEICEIVFFYAIAIRNFAIFANHFTTLSPVIIF